MAGPDLALLPDENEPLELTKERARDTAKVINRNQKKAVLACNSRHVFWGLSDTLINELLTKYT